MISRFLLNALLSNNVYLGYTKNFRHASMNFDIKATAASQQTDIHNLNHTILGGRKLLLQLQSTWYKYGNSWIVLSRLPAAIRYANKFIKRNISYFEGNRNAILTLWQSNWISGLLTNKMAFKGISGFKRFPAMICYLNYTNNRSRFNEARNLGILQGGLADTNANFLVYQYGINASEKSSESYLYFLSLILSSSFNHIRYSCKKFLVQ